MGVSARMCVRREKITKRERRSKRKNWCNGGGGKRESVCGFNASCIKPPESSILPCLEYSLNVGDSNSLQIIPKS